MFEIFFRLFFYLMKVCQNVDDYNDAIPQMMVWGLKRSNDLKTMHKLM